MKEVNSQLRNSFAKLRSFPGATLKHLKYYIVPSLIDEIPDRIILHGRCNDVNNKNSTPEKIEIKSQTQKRLLVNAYFMSQFGYCPLVWM